MIKKRCLNLFSVTIKQVGTPIALLLALLLSSCGNIGDITDKVLYGTTLDAQSRQSSCTPNLHVTHREITLLEDGDVTASFDLSKDKGIAESDADGGTSWGYRSFETCLYPTASFTGTLTFSVSSNGNYDGRITANRSFPDTVDGDPLPEELTFTGTGSANRQCFRFQRVDDAIRNVQEDPLVIALGSITELDGDGNINSSGAYHGADVCDISVTVEDDEGPGIRVSNISNVMEEPGVSTTNSVHLK